MGFLHFYKEPSKLGEPVAELSYGNFVPESQVPCRVFVFQEVRVVAVAVGDEFTVAVTEAGVVYSLGIGDGRLGHGEMDDVDNVFLPKRIEALDGIHVATVAAGDCHALALTSHQVRTGLLVGGDGYHWQL